MKKLLTASVASLLVAWSSLAAAAPSRSLGAAQGALPADTEVVMGSSWKTVRSTQLYARAFSQLMAMERDVREGLASVKSTCGVDPVQAIDDLAVGVDKKEEGVVFVALTGVNEAKLIDCLTKIALAEGGEKIATKKVGQLTEITGDKSTKKFYFAWLPGDVLAFATEPDDKALLERMLGGRGALRTSKLGTRLARLPQDGAVVAAWTKPIPTGALSVKSGDVAIVYASGQVTAEAGIETGSADEADQVAAATKVAGSMLGLPKDAPKELSALVRSLEASTNGPEVKVRAKASEKDLVVILDWLIATQGGSRAKPVAAPPAPQTKPAPRAAPKPVKPVSPDEIY